MSATLNANLFLDYFQGGGSRRKGATAATGISSCTMLSIPGRTFPVSCFYLEDAFQVTDFELSPTSPCLASQQKKGSERGGKKGSGSGGGAAVQAEEKRLRRYYLETLRQSRKYTEKTIANLEAVDESIVNAELIVKLVVHIMSTESIAPAASVVDVGVQENLGAILIFVPGLANIQGIA